MYQKSAREIRQTFINGEMTAEAIAQYFLRRIESFDPKLQAFLHVLSERVLSKARELDKKRKEGKTLGKLAAVPVAIKDNIHIEDEITTCGSKFLKNYRAPFSATVVKRLEEEDALLIGKTNLDEFAMGSSTENSAYQTTKNPWNLKCSPGGSSGGSAAAVAARFCPIALGSDTGGSIRQPAAFTGIVGFKPTYGRVSRYGLVAFGSSLDQIGPMTYNVEDAALVMEVLGHPCEYDSTSIHEVPDPYLPHLEESLQGKKIGVPWSFLENAPHIARQNFEQSLKHFEKLGVEIIDISMKALNYSIPIYYIISTAEASTNLARFDGVRYGMRSKHADTLEDLYLYSRQEGFGSEVKKRILLGTYVLSAGYQDAYYKKAQKIRTLLIQECKQAFERCDIIAMPTTPTPPFEINTIHNPVDMYLQDIYTTCANLAGVPAISVPTGFDGDHKPLGIHLLGPLLEDVRVMRFAHQFEKSVQFYNHIPSLFNHEVQS
ncbi:MAG: Asp-tRNA(Asn)/Glu-tRNA(Gln) amidotransferase subunit GatA [Simkaniaceae bacterium]